MLQKIIITIVAAIAVIGSLAAARHVIVQRSMPQYLAELHRERVKLEGEKGWMTPQWAYKTENISDRFRNETLSRLGKEGWEMVSARREVDRRAIDRYGAPHTEFVFKRQR